MVALTGELDLATAPFVSATLERELHTDGDVVIDARDVSFVDVSGARVLLRTAERLPTGRQLVVAGAPTRLVKVLQLCGWLDHPGLSVQPRALRSAA